MAMMQAKDTMDVESGHKAGAGRGRCLERCLLLSVVVLFAGLSALAAAGALLLHNLQARLHPEFKASGVIGTHDKTFKFKMENFAFLEATSSALKNHTMPLEENSYLAGKSVGSNFKFNPVQRSLQVTQVGMYFLYMELNLTCVSRCEAGLLAVHLSDKLSCEVHLPITSDSQPIQRKCWTVTHLSSSTHLLAHMSLPRGPLHHWKLELQGSGVGMFLVN